MAEDVQLDFQLLLKFIRLKRSCANLKITIKEKNAPNSSSQNVQSTSTGTLGFTKSALQSFFEKDNVLGAVLNSTKYMGEQKAIVDGIYKFMLTKVGNDHASQAQKVATVKAAHTIFPNISTDVLLDRLNNKIKNIRQKVKKMVVVGEKIPTPDESK